MLPKQIALLLILTVAKAENEASSLSTNPIRKVVTMLQNMQKKVEEEGETQKKLFDKFMCYCQNSGGVLQASIESAEAKIPRLTSEITSGKEKTSQLQDEVKQHKADLAEALDAMKKAKVVREQEAAAFKKYSEEAGVNMQSVNKAVAALVKGMGKSFLQSNDAQVVQKVVVSDQDMPEEDRQEVLSFLSGSAYGESPSGGEIVGILKEMAASLERAIGEAARAEAASSKAYEELMAAKKKEVDALNTAIRTKSKRIGELAVELVQKQEDLDDTEKGLAEDTKFAGQMKTSCATKESEYQKESNTRQQELQAIAETIKILNDDDALDLFKKTLPSAASSFLDIGASMSKVREQVVDFLHRAKAANRGDHTQLDLIVLALKGKKIGFDSIIKKVDALIEELTKEQEDDTKKKVYCMAAFDKGEDKTKSIERDISDTDSEIDSEVENLAAMKEDLAALDTHIKELDKDVAEATEQRKEEHEAYLQQIAANTAAKQLLQFAKQRLSKFYGAALAQMEEDGAGPGVPSYKKKTQESRGVVAMIDTLIADIETDMATLETEEKDAQSDYEATIKEAREKRSSDAKALTGKSKAKADVTSELQDNKGEKSSLTKELMTHEERIQKLHKACDWLVQNFDTRRTARSTEIENLKNAKLVLAGVGGSFLQKSASSFLAHRG